jgi:hypothetical protein
MFRYENSGERRNCGGSATGYAGGAVRAAWRVVRDFVTVFVIRAGIIAMCVMCSMVRCVIVRGAHAGIMVAQRHT